MEKAIKYSLHIQTMIKAAQRAYRVVARDFLELESLQSTKKSLSDFADKIDSKASFALVSELQKSKPDYGIIAEDSDVIEGKDNFRWIVDPIDGTSNFVHANPNFAVSIALEKTNILQLKKTTVPSVGYIVAALIYLPFSNEIYWAEKDSGSYYINANGHQNKIKVSSGLNQPSVSTIIRHNCSSQYMNILSDIKNEGIKIRISGSIAKDMSYIASGRIDAMFIESYNPWDVAAGVLLIEEAGGEVLFKNHLLFAGGKETVKIISDMLEN